MQINNITHINFKNPPAALKRKAETNPIRKSLEENASFKEYTFADYQKPAPSLIQAEDIIDLCDFFKDNNITLTSDAAIRAIEQYYSDAKEMAKIPEIAHDFKENFEKDIKTADFSFLNNIRSFYKAGLVTKRQVLKEANKNKDITPDGIAQYTYKDGTTIFNSKVDSSLKPFVDACIEVFKEQLPQYKITLYKNINDDGEVQYEYIELGKDDCCIGLTSGQFIYDLLNKELTGNYKIAISENDDITYNYYPESLFVEKQDMRIDEIVGAIDISLCNEKGEAVFDIDEGLESGPSFYAARLIDVGNRIIKAKEQTIRFLDSADESTKKLLINLIENDEEAKSLYLHCFPPEMLLCCIRNGCFNMNIAEVAAALLNTTKNWQDNSISYEYMNNLINLMDNEDHYIENDLIEVASAFLELENNSLEDHHDTVYKAISIAKKYITNKNIQNMLITIGASEHVNFDEADTLLDVISLKQENKDEEAQEKIKNLAKENFEKWGSEENAIKAYKYYTNVKNFK